MCYKQLRMDLDSNGFYPDLPSARRPVPHSDLLSVPPFRELPQLSEDESCMSAIAQGKESDAPR